MSSETRILLARHGQTRWNRAGKFMGHTDIPMDAYGCRQAERLAGIVLQYEPTAILCSPLQRAQKTAEIASYGLSCTPETDHRWIEVDIGRLAGKTRRQAEDEFEDFFETWRRNPADAVRPGGESDRMRQIKAAESLQQLARARKRQTVLVVSHGGTIKTVIAWALHLPLGQKWRLSVDCGSLSSLLLVDEKWRLEFLNYTEHLTGDNSK